VNNLRFSQHRHHVQCLIEAGLAAADPAAAVSRHLQLNGRILTIGDVTYDVDQGRVVVIAVGKAALAMGAAAAEILGPALTAGILINKRESSAPAQRQATDDQLTQALGQALPQAVKLRLAGHPVPDQAGVSATAEVIDMLAQTASRDLVLCLISGGASALLTQPILPLEQWQRLVDALLASGCTINELNAVRKRMDRVKGGGLARIAAPAVCVSLILSDVVGNPLDVIGSGPTVANPDPPALAGDILERYRLAERLGPDDWAAVSDQLNDLETAIPAEIGYGHNVIVGDVRQAALAAVEAASELGFDARLLTAHLEGEAREVARVVAALAKDAPPATCLVLGGETTVTLAGQGLGGRNQELALAAAIAIDGWPDCVVASFATDGDDGPTTAAGGLVSGETLTVARRLGLTAQNYLDNNDSYHFLEATGALLTTGQTGTNVNDLIFVLKYGDELKADSQKLTANS
jgi:hydroxypyruvate reductase